MSGNIGAFLQRHIIVVLALPAVVALGFGSYSTFFRPAQPARHVVASSGSSLVNNHEDITFK